MAEPSTREQLLACVLDPMFNWRKYPDELYDSAIRHLKDAVDAIGLKHFSILAIAVDFVALLSPKTHRKALAPSARTRL